MTTKYEINQPVKVMPHNKAHPKEMCGTISNIIINKTGVHYSVQVKDHLFFDTMTMADEDEIAPL